MCILQLVVCIFLDVGWYYFGGLLVPVSACGALEGNEERNYDPYRTNYENEKQSCCCV